MATIDSVKIALKSTTKMSLNERFQQIRQQNTSNKSIANQNRLALRQGSQKNIRLALQMANRPSVLAALRPHNPSAGRPVKQRLGIKRFNNQTIINQNQRNRNQNQNPFRNQMNFNNNKTFNQNKVRNQNQNRKNNNKNIGVIVGFRRTGMKTNRLRRTQTLNTTHNIIKTGFKPKRRVGQQIRNQNQAKTSVKKKFQINRNFNARNTGKPFQQKKRNVRPNREQLDKDLDAYMSGTKTYLDAELDAYMTQTIN